MASNITQLLQQVRAGDGGARNELVDVVYVELLRIAQRHLRSERPEHTLEPTALVHEAYLKLFAAAEPQFVDRVHFFAVISQVMRRILVDHARSRATARRGGGRLLRWDETVQVEADGLQQTLNMADLDAALDALERQDEPLARLIEMRYFGGMTAQETAEVTGRSVHVIRHDLRLAQAWLRREMARQSS